MGHCPVLQKTSKPLSYGDSHENDVVFSFLFIFHSLYGRVLEGGLVGWCDWCYSAM